MARSREHPSRWVVVEAIDDEIDREIGFRDHLFIQRGVEGGEMDIRIDGGKSATGDIGLAGSDIGRIKKNLPVHIGDLDDIPINECNPSDACACEIHQDRGSQPAGTGNEDVRLLQSALAGGADTGQTRLARVPIRHQPPCTGGLSVMVSPSDGTWESGIKRSPENAIAT